MHFTIPLAVLVCQNWNNDERIVYQPKIVIQAFISEMIRLMILDTLTLYVAALHQDHTDNMAAKMATETASTFCKVCIKGSDLKKIICSFFIVYCDK